MTGRLVAREHDTVRLSLEIADLKGTYTMMSLYQKKPITIEAVQVTVENKDRVFHFIRSYGCPNAAAGFNNNGEPTIIIPTLEGDMAASMGDWIVKGVSDEFYPIKPDIFAKLYDMLTDRLTRQDAHEKGATP